MADAASVMLAALRSIAKIPKEGEPCSEADLAISWADDGHGSPAVEVLQDAIDTARAAVAKAEGKTNG